VRQVQLQQNYQIANFPVVDDIYRPDRVKEAVNVMGADDPAHPSVTYLRTRVKEFYVGGKISAIQLPVHFDYVPLRCQLHLC
jgi:sulfate adenylyltransferase